MRRYFNDINTGIEYYQWFQNIVPYIYKNLQENRTKTFFCAKTFWIYQPLIIAYKAKSKECEINTDIAKDCLYSDYQPCCFETQYNSATK